jgi:hypothetical protein
MTEDEGWINLIHLVVWAWDCRSASVSTLNQVVPQTPHLPSGSTSEIGLSVNQWCQQWGLDVKDGDVLDKLGFQVGSDLGVLSPDDWRHAGMSAFQRE